MPAMTTYRFRRFVTALLAGAAVLLSTVCGGGPRPARAAAQASQAVDCSRLPSKETFVRERYDRETIRKIQMCLAVKGYYTCKLDGIKGPQTIAALAKVTAGSPDTTPSLQKDGPITVYELTSQDLEELKALNEIIAQLQELQGVEFADGFELITAVKTAIKEVTDRYAGYQAIVMKQLDQLKSYVLTEKQFDALEQAQVPENVVDALRDLQDEPFADKEALTKAVTAKLQEVGDPTGYYRGQILRDVDEMAVFSLPDSLFLKLEEMRVPDEVLKRLKKLGDVEFPTRELFENALETDIFTPMKTEQEADCDDCRLYRAVLLAKAEKKPRFDAKKKVQWSGWSCGCYLDNLSGVIYGFYPFWKGGNRQKIDFSSFSRIGYFALTFDEKGEIPERRHWQQKSPDLAAFINQARRYRTAVDLVFYKSTWENWAQFVSVKRTSVIDTLTTNMVELIDAKLENSMLNRMKPLISLGSAPKPAMGDGITLFFAGYPNDAASNEFLKLFIRELRKKLTAASGSFKLNLVLPYREIGRLKDLISEGKDKKEAVSDVDLFLVLIDRPITKSKKDLRLEVEKMFTGIVRRDALRRIVPVITWGTATSPSEKQQFFDDMVYFEDNFGGAGFWPIPTNSDNGAAEIGETIKDVFVMTDNQDYFQAMFSERFPWFGTFVGPNRWELRIVLDILLALIILAASLSCWIFELRDIFRKHPLWLLGVILAATLIQMCLFVGDPYWRNRTTEILLLAVAAGAGVGILFYIRRIKRVDLP